MKKHLRCALLLTLGVVEATLPARFALAEQPAEEATTASKAEKSSSTPAGAPAFRTVGFTDADVSQSCDPAAAALGGCIEEVQFLDLRAAWLNTPLDRADRARFSVIATLYASMWDDLALRWGDDDGALVDLYAKSRLTALPWPDVQWESTNTARKPRISLPDTALWLDPGFWVQSSAPVADARAPVFPLLRQAVPLGPPARPQVVLLRGRMAHGLRVGGKAHPYELMDGDPQYSGPFFEQMYPFDMGVDKVLLGASGIDPETPCPQLPPGIADQACPPLWRFQVPEAIRRGGESAIGVIYPSTDWQPLVLQSDDKDETNLEYEVMRERVSEAFDSYFLRISGALARFGAAEFTDTQIRALAALLAMHAPPGTYSGFETSDTSENNPATPGETDTIEQVERSLAPSRDEAGDTRQISVEPLSLEVIELGLRRSAAALGGQPTEALTQKVRALVKDRLRDNVRQDCSAIPKDFLDPRDVDTWAMDCAMPGQDIVVARMVKRIALLAALKEIGQHNGALRSAIETWLLMAQTELGYVPTLTRLTTSAAATPKQAQDEFTKQWTDAVKAQRITPGKVPQRPGGPNPLAVCGQRSGPEALDEASVRPIDVDLLVVAQRGLKQAGDVLWSARDHAPFQMVDAPVSWSDPKRPSDPVVTALADLPQDRSVYRVRWRMWSGWHLLWRAEAPLGGSASRLMRLTVQTAVFCEDTVLSEPALVPTLVHAGLLADPMRGTGVSALPGRPGARMDEEPRPVREGDQVVQETGERASDATRGASQALSNGEAMLEDPTRISELSAAGLGASTGARPVAEIINTTSIESPGEYLRGLVREALGRGVGVQDQLTLVVFDLAEGVDRHRTWHFRPRTPYSTTSRRRGGGKVTRAASWAVVTPADERFAAWPLASPGYLPTNSVRTLSDSPRWKRDDQLDFWLIGHLGTMAQQLARESTYPGAVTFDDQRCGVDQQDPGEPTCMDPWRAQLSAVMSWWWLDQPRWAFEIGPTVSFIQFPDGQTWFAPEQHVDPDKGEEEGPRFEFRTGLVLGARVAPGAGPLRWSLGQGYPWGAERPDARSLLRRSQGGLRFSGVLSTEYDGVYGDIGAELWWGWSIRRGSAPSASLTPYRPAFLLGPQLQVQAGKAISGQDTTAYYYVRQRASVTLGITGQIRLGDGLPSLPEAE